MVVWSHVSQVCVSSVNASEVGWAPPLFGLCCTHGSHTCRQRLARLRALGIHCCFAFMSRDVKSPSLFIRRNARLKQDASRAVAHHLNVFSLVWLIGPRGKSAGSAAAGCAS